MIYMSVLYFCLCACSVPQSCPTLFDPMDCSLPGSSVYGISQARILEWVVISYPGGSFWPKDQICIPYFGRQILYHCSTFCLCHTFVWDHLNANQWRRTWEPLNEGERGEWKTWLKTQHSKMKIMASGPITSWQIEGETMETIIDFILGAP